SPVCLPGRRNRWPVGNDVAAGWTSTSPAKLASTAAAGRGPPAPAVAATGGPCIPHAGATRIPSLPATYAAGMQALAESFWTLRGPHRDRKSVVKGKREGLARGRDD